MVAAPGRERAASRLGPSEARCPTAGSRWEDESHSTRTAPALESEAGSLEWRDTGRGGGGGGEGGGREGKGEGSE